MITPNTTGAPAAAPSLASDSAKQLASLASRTGPPRAWARSRSSGWPFSTTVFGPLDQARRRREAPGHPTPTLPR
jgi:hypothetical protein